MRKIVTPKMRVATRMKAVGREKWSTSDMERLCKYAGIYNTRWSLTATRKQEENAALFAAKMLDVEIV
jgi:hypothetical protein